MSKKHWNKREQEVRKETIEEIEKMIDEESMKWFDSNSLCFSDLLKIIKNKLKEKKE